MRKPGTSRAKNGLTARRDGQRYTNRKGGMMKNPCPHCDKPMNHFSGLEAMPSGEYCEDCNDAIYDEGEKVLCSLF